MTRATNRRVNDHQLKISSEAAASVHENGVVILDAGKGRLFSSNQTGAYIWRCIEQHLSLEAIADKVSSEYQIDSGSAREHTARFVAELERYSLVARRAA